MQFTFSSVRQLCAFFLLSKLTDSVADNNPCGLQAYSSANVSTLNAPLLRTRLLTPWLRASISVSGRTATMMPAQHAILTLTCTRDVWARSSPNPNVKIFVGVPASSTAAGGGYQDPATLATILQNTRSRFPSFGGMAVVRPVASDVLSHVRRCYDVGRFSGLR